MISKRTHLTDKALHVVTVSLIFRTDLIVGVSRKQQLIRFSLVLNYFAGGVVKNMTMTRATSLTVADPEVG